MAKIECQGCGGSGQEDDPTRCLCCGRRAEGKDRFETLFGGYKCSDCRKGK